jgi:hypothetical protein
MEPTDAVEFPSGTRFKPYWAATPNNCELELLCGSGGAGDGYSCPGCNDPEHLLASLDFPAMLKCETIYLPLPHATIRSIDYTPIISAMNPVDIVGEQPDYSISWDTSVSMPPDVTVAYVTARTTDNTQTAGFHRRFSSDTPFVNLDGVLNAPPQIAGQSFVLDIALGTDRGNTPAGQVYLITRRLPETNRPHCPCTGGDLTCITEPPLSDPSLCCSYFESFLSVLQDEPVPDGTVVERSYMSDGHQHSYYFKLDCSSY